jgi:predicted MarR family transcription regulator
MGETNQSTSAKTFEGLVAQTHGPRRLIVTGLRFYGGQANSQQLRRYGDIPSRNYHFNKLEEQGVIEQVGNDASGGGDAAKVYRLTELGQEVAEELESTEETSTVTELEERIAHLEGKIEEMDELLYGIAVRTGVIDETDESAD